jgi:hypothetical protein
VYSKPLLFNTEFQLEDLLDPQASKIFGVLLFFESLSGVRPYAIDGKSAKNKNCSVKCKNFSINKKQQISN